VPPAEGCSRAIFTTSGRGGGGAMHDDDELAMTDRLVDLGTRYEKNPSFVARRVADEFILVPTRRQASEVESIYSLNEVAALIWELIGEGRTVADIRDAVVGRFEVALALAEQDVRELLADLEEIGAIQAT
jgi:hypothetical protein